jgi:tRNA1Val (adenine37-N6)-methyltransferase
LLPQTAAAFTNAGCPPTAMLPLWSKAGHPAKLLLLRGIRGGRAAFRVLPGLVLHRPDGSFTAEADAILRGGGALDL